MAVSILQGYVEVPLGLAYLPKEVGNAPKAWTKTLGPAVHMIESDKDWHFAAWARSDVIADDLKKMVGKEGRAYGAVGKEWLLRIDKYIFRFLIHCLHQSQNLPYHSRVHFPSFL